MAIDTTMFGVPVPAASYTKGQRVSMPVLRGPAVVRDGYGAAYFKKLFCSFSASNSGIRGHVELKNGNWVDSVANLVSDTSNVALSENSSGIQRGHDAPLTPNSGWQCEFVFDAAVTTTVATDVVALIDIDYPSVQAVQNPRTSPGFPVTIMREDSIAMTASGSVNVAPWTTFNVDIFKAGSKYLLTEMGLYITGSDIAFVSISGAAGQNGLERIIPAIAGRIGNLRYLLDYSTPLVKGPMNINYMALGTAGTVTTITEIDWVKK